MTTTPAPTGRGWAYAGAILGGAASIAANVAHSFIGPDPSALEIAFSVFWPAALFVCVEVLARVAFPRGFGYAALRFVGVSLVALVAAIVSYRHLSGLFRHYGEDAVTVTVGPLAIDGLLAVCSAALILTARKRALATPEEPAQPAPVYVPAEWTQTPYQTPQDAPVSPAPTQPNPEPVPAVLDDPATPAPATVEEPAEEPTPEPTDPRMVTRLAFGPLPEENPERYRAIRERAEMFRTEDAKRSQQNLADLIGIPRRTLRDALAATAPQPTDPPALTLITN